MIAFLSILSSAAYANPITIDLRDTYLTGDTVVVSIDVKNNNKESLTIPDLSHDTWRTSFTFKSKGFNQTRRSKKKKTTKSWRIKPHGSRKVHLEIPSSSSLKSGAYKLTVNVDAGSLKQETTKEITLLKPTPTATDLLQQNDKASRVIWIQPHEQHPSLYYNSGKQNWWIANIKSSTNPRLTICKECGPEVTWQDGSTFNYTDRFGEIQKAPLPWPKAKWLGRAALSGSVHAVIWAPAPRGNTGDLWLLNINRKGRPAYQKMRTAGLNPQFIRTALTERKSPLFLIADSNRVELYKADEEFAKRNHPVPVKTIRRIKNDEKLRDQRFSIHPEHGLSILLTFQQESRWLYEWRSLKGTLISQSEINAPASATILDVRSQNQTIRWLFESKGTQSIVSLNGSIPVVIENPAILWGENKLLEFTSQARTIRR